MCGRIGLTFKMLFIVFHSMGDVIGWTCSTQEIGTADEILTLFIEEVQVNGT
jgi:hypothetical protein